ncbi:MAG: CDP-diacylglycerol--glycerol-3-phosphate 3-phosphatidyltransferase [Rhodospirillales bacterium]|nr:CDP-diacylglycerol--glycerol-3-phosphate 3-phosphatidyltransferase [Rhodospirillales bacterium]
MYYNLPNILTFSRIIAIPVLVYFIFLESPFGNWAAFGVYTFASITDFFDGYLARAWSQQSSLGKFLDPIADKLLVCAILILLAGFGPLDGIHILPSIVILSREITVSGLREFLAEIRVSVPVTNLAKWKTALQMFALGFLVIGEVGPTFGSFTSTEIGIFGIWAAAVLTLVTGYDYLRSGLKHIQQQDENNSAN